MEGFDLMTDISAQTVSAFHGRRDHQVRNVMGYL